MTFTIRSMRKVEDTLFTLVDFNFNGNVVTVDIPHFQPATRAEVRQGIMNRAASENAKRIAGARCNLIATEMQPEIGTVQ